MCAPPAEPSLQPAAPSSGVSIRLFSTSKHRQNPPSSTSWCTRLRQKAKPEIRATRNPRASSNQDIQSCRLEFAGRLVGRSSLRSMQDPRTTLSAQDLIYAATALRVEARRAEAQAADPQYISSRQVFERSARIAGALAAKFDAIAKAVSSVVCFLSPETR